MAFPPPLETHRVISHAMTLRLSKRLHRMVVEVAKDEGVTQSQFVREAILIRLTYMRALADPDATISIERTVRELWKESNGL